MNTRSPLILLWTLALAWPCLAEPGEFHFTFDDADPRGLRAAWDRYPADLWRWHDGAMQNHQARDKVTAVATLPNGLFLRSVRLRLQRLATDGPGESPGECRIALSTQDRRPSVAYVVHLNGQVIRLTRDWQSLATAPLPLPSGRWIELAIDVSPQGHVAVSVDGQQVLRADTDLDHETLVRLALHSIGVTAAFDDVTIRGEALPLYPRVFEPAAAVNEAGADPSGYLAQSTPALLLRPGMMAREPLDSLDPPADTPFVGVSNLIADPSFEHEGEPVWRPMHGQGRADVDESAKAEGRRSLRVRSVGGAFTLAGNAAPIDWQRPYRFTGQVRGQGVGRLAIAWYGSDGSGIRAGHNTFANPDVLLEGPRDHRMGVTVSDPVRAGETWSQVALTAAPPRGAWAGQFQIISDTGDDGALAWDDLQCSAFGAPRVQVIVAAAGYQRQGEKRAVVLCDQPLAGATWQLLGGDDSVAASGELTPLGRYDWLDAHAAAADFSSVQRDGEFRLLVRPTTGPAETSVSFPIRDALYLSLARLMAGHFRIIRSGEEVPGWHQACFLDDSLVYDRAGGKVMGHRDLVGGWFDAGDYGYFNIRTWPSLYALAELQRRIAPPWGRDLTAEVAWGGDYLLKAHRGSGVFFGRKFSGRGGGWDGPPSLETDNIPGTADDRPVIDATRSLPSAAAVLAAAAQAVKPVDAPRAGGYLDLAQTVYEHTTAGWRAGDEGFALPLGLDLVFWTRDPAIKSFVIHPTPGQLGFAYATKGWAKATPYYMELQGEAIWLLERRPEDRAAWQVLIGGEHNSSNAQRLPPRVDVSWDLSAWQDPAVRIVPISGDQHHNRFAALVEMPPDRDRLYVRLRGQREGNAIIRRMFFLPRPATHPTSSLEQRVSELPVVFSGITQFDARSVPAPPRFERWEQLYFLPNMLLAQIELHRATGDPLLSAQIEPSLATLLPLVRDRVYLDPAYMGNTAVVKGGASPLRYDFIIGPLWWLRDQPGTPLAAEIRGAVRSFIEGFLLPRVSVATSPFGQFGSYLDAGQWHMGPPYHTEHFAQAAYVLALAANVLDEPAWRVPAQRQLQFLLGLNPLGASYICGTSAPTYAAWSGLHHVPGHEDSMIPGAMSKGMQWGRGRLNDRSREAPRLGAPWGSPHGYVWPGGAFTHGSPAQEIWQWFSGPVILAAMELHDGLAQDRRPKGVAPLPLGSANLLSNSGFEDEPFLHGWRAKGNPVAHCVSDMPQHGQRGLQLSTEGGAAALSNDMPLPVEVNDRFWLSVWALGHGTLRATLRMGDGQDEAPPITLDPRLRRYDLQLRAKGSGNASLTLQLIGSRVVLDNVELRRLPPENTGWPDVVFTRRLDSD